MTAPAPGSDADADATEEAAVEVGAEDARTARAQRLRARMDDLGVDALLLSLGADLHWLTGHQAPPLERLTMLVFPADDRATLVVPRLEAPLVPRNTAWFDVHPWDETDDPVGVVAGLVGGRRRLAVSDQTWARFVLALQDALPAAGWQPASAVTSPLRAVKDDQEVEALARAAKAADVVAADLLGGKIPLVGRTEAEVAADISDRLLRAGHRKINFCIVGSGPHSASPHHEPGARRIEANEAVVCDFGGTLDGYCSDITRTVFTGDPPAEFGELYGVLQAAQAAAVEAAVVGTACEAVDAAARTPITEAGFGERFVHRTGHGIGLEEHEDPYLVAGNTELLAAGHAFSVEPGIYVPDKWGARIEDIVVATASGPRALNQADHALAVVES